MGAKRSWLTRDGWSRWVGRSPVAVLFVLGSIVSFPAVGFLVPSGVSAASLTPVATGAPGAPVSLSQRWVSCADGEGGQCAKLTAPLDWAKPSGATFDLQLVKIAATSPKKRIGSLLVNPGGPGASGRKFARQLQGGALPAVIRERFDIIGWDPRGVGSTLPITCLGPSGTEALYSADQTPDSPAEFDQLVAITKQFTEACAANSSRVLDHVSTADVVKDMEAIRVGLGEAKISYLGFSYGTLLGAAYADAYPNRVRAFVLDGVLDPTADSNERVRRQALGFETELNHFLADCQKRRCSFVGKGKTAGASFDAAMLAAENSTIKVGKRTLGPGDAWYGVIASLYDKTNGWPALERAVASLGNGDGSAFLSIADSYARRRSDGTYENVAEANSAVNCTDIPAPRDPEAYRTLAKEFTKVAPRLGAFAAYSSIACAFWPAKVTGSLAPLRAKGSDPILLIGTTNDPATPLVWAQSLQRQLANAALLTYSGEGHTALLTGNSCVRKVVVKYLVDLANVAPGKVCKAS
jgi:pimeloyl-ACP methyl ester carboxylesterase